MANPTRTPPPPHTPRRPSQPTRSLLALASGLVLATGLVLGGCDKGDDTQTLLTRAANELEMLSAGTAAPPDPAYAKRVYATVRTTLAPVLADGLPAEQAAANLLIAETQLGEAGDALAQASAANAAMLDRLDDTRALFARWQQADAQAAALEHLDSRDEIQKARDAIAASKARQSEQEHSKQQIDDQIATKLAAIAGLKAQINDRRDKAATLRIEADRVTPDDAVTLVRQAQSYSREADSLEMQAELTQLEIDRLTPQSEALGIEINNLKAQQASLAQVVDRLTQRDAQTRAEAARARAHADELAEQLDAAIFAGDGLTSERTGELTDKTQAAVAAYTKANATARSAQQELRSQAALTIARAQQSIGRLQWAKARTLESYQTFLAEIKAVPDYANASENSPYAAETAQVAASIDEALKASGEAYEAARTALDGAGARDAEAKASIEAAQRLLAISAQATADRTMDLSAAMADAAKATEADRAAQAPATPAAQDQASPAANASDPRAQLENVVGRMLDMMRQGQLTQTVSLYDFSDPAHRSVFEAVAKTFDAAVRLENACQAKFGQGLAALGGGMPGMDVTKSLDALATIKPSDMTITITGDTAVVQMPDLNNPGTSQPTTFRLRNGTWRADGSSALADADTNQLQAMLPIMDTLTTALNQIAAQVESGQITSIAQVGQALRKAMGAPGGGG